MIHHPFCIVGFTSHGRIDVNVEDRHVLHVAYVFKCVTISTGVSRILAYIVRRVSKVKAFGR